MKHVIVFLFSAAVVCGASLAFAHPQATLPPAGLTPSSPFYFLDRLGEALQEFFTFSPESKAKLQVKFAAERISEVKIILELQGALAPGIEIALDGLHENITKVADILDGEADKGRDVSQLAQDLKTQFDDENDALKDAFKDRKNFLEKQEEQIKSKIAAAERANNLAEAESLKDQLENIEEEKDELELTAEQEDEELDIDEEAIEDRLSEEKSVEELESKELETEMEKIEGLEKEILKTPRPASAPKPVSAPTPTPPVKEEMAETQSFIIEGDDSGLYPSEIKVKKGDGVEITFKVRSSGVYFGGLDFRGSPYFNTGTIKPGESKTIKFTASETFNFSSYWPASGVLKATGKVIVD